MTGSITVFGATPDDTEAIRGLCRCLDPDDYVIRAWDGWVRVPGDVNLAAMMDGRVVGCIHAGFESDVEVFSQGIRVERNAQRHGVATALVVTQEAILTERGVEAIRGTTGRNNARARAFFEAAGYREAAVVARRSISTWPGGRSCPTILSPEESLEEIRRADFLASRPGLAVFKRIYRSPSRSWLEDAARQGRTICTSDHAWAIHDPITPGQGLWIAALGGSPEALRELILGLRAPQVPGPALTIDAPADPELQAMLDALGFEPPEKLDEYVVLEGGFLTTTPQASSHRCSSSS